MEELNQYFASPLILHYSNFERKNFWFTVSNAFFQSRKTPQEYKSLLQNFHIHLVTSISVFVVELYSITHSFLQNFAQFRSQSLRLLHSKAITVKCTAFFVD